MKLPPFSDVKVMKRIIGLLLLVSACNLHREIPNDISPSTSHDPQVQAESPPLAQADAPVSPAKDPEHLVIDPAVEVPKAKTIAARPTNPKRIISTAEEPASPEEEKEEEEPTEATAILESPVLGAVPKINRHTWVQVGLGVDVIYLKQQMDKNSNSEVSGVSPAIDLGASLSLSENTFLLFEYEETRLQVKGQSEHTFDSTSFQFSSLYLGLGYESNESISINLGLEVDQKDILWHNSFNDFYIGKMKVLNVSLGLDYRFDFNENIDVGIGVRVLQPLNGETDFGADMSNPSGYDIKVKAEVEYKFNKNHSAVASVEFNQADQTITSETADKEFSGSLVESKLSGGMSYKYRF